MQAIGTNSKNNTWHRLQEMYSTIVLAGCTLSTCGKVGLGWTWLDVLGSVPQERHPNPLPPHTLIRGLRGDRNHLTELADPNLCNLD